MKTALRPLIEMLKAKNEVKSSSSSAPCPGNVDPPENSSFCAAPLSEMPVIHYGMDYMDIYALRFGNMTQVDWALSTHDPFFEHHAKSMKALLYDDGPVTKVGIFLKHRCGVNILV